MSISVRVDGFVRAVRNRQFGTGRVEHVFSVEYAPDEWVWVYAPDDCVMSPGEPVTVTGTGYRFASCTGTKALVPDEMSFGSSGDRPGAPAHTERL